VPGLNTDQRLSRLQSHDARHGRVPQQEDFAAKEPQLNIAIAQHGPFRVAVAHELADMGHHGCLCRIGRGYRHIAGRGCSPAAPFGPPSGPPVAKWEHRLEIFLVLVPWTSGDVMRVSEGREPTQSNPQHDTACSAWHSDLDGGRSQGSSERQVEPQAADRVVLPILQLQDAMVIKA